MMYKFQWLGNPFDVEIKNAIDPCSLIDWESNGANVQCYTESPSSVLSVKEEYALADCVLNFCKDSERRTWTETEGPCREHRKGPLCGQCQEGYAVTPSSLVTNTLRNRWPDKWIDSQTGSWIDRWTDRLTDRQADTVSDHGT